MVHAREGAAQAPVAVVGLPCYSPSQTSTWTTAGCIAWPTPMMVPVAATTLQLPPALQPSAPVDPTCKLHEDLAGIVRNARKVGERTVDTHVSYI